MLAFSVRHSLAEAERRVERRVAAALTMAAALTIAAEEEEAGAEAVAVAVVTEEVEEAVKVKVGDGDDCGGGDDGDGDVAHVDDEGDHPSSFPSHPLILHGRRHGVDHR